MHTLRTGITVININIVIINVVININQVPKLITEPCFRGVKWTVNFSMRPVCRVEWGSVKTLKCLCSLTKEILVS